MWPRSAAQCGPGSEAQQSLETELRAGSAGLITLYRRGLAYTASTDNRWHRPESSEGPRHRQSRLARPGSHYTMEVPRPSLNRTQLTHFRWTRSRKPRPPAPTILHRIGQFLQHQSAGLQHFKAGLGCWHLCCCLSVAPMLL